MVNSVPADRAVNAARHLDAMDDDEEVSLRRAAQILGYSYPSILRFRDAKYFLAIKKGGQWCVTVRELKRFNREGNRTPDSEAVASGRIYRDAEGVDLSDLNTEERDRLGSIPPISKGHSNET